MSIIDALQWRYATKAYDTTTPLTEAQIQKIKDALRLAPSSFGLQAWKFIEVTDPAVRTRLREAGFNQPQFTDAGALFILATYTHIDEAFVDGYMQQIADTRGIDVAALAGFKQAIMGAIGMHSPASLEAWLARQVYIPLGMALTVAAAESLDSTPMEGFNNAAVDEILGLAAHGLTSRVALAVGHRSPEDATQHYAKVRLPEAEAFITI